MPPYHIATYCCVFHFFRALIIACFGFIGARSCDRYERRLRHGERIEETEMDDGTSQVEADDGSLPPPLRKRAWRLWLRKWLALRPNSTIMKRANPKIVPREWMLAQACKFQQCGAFVHRITKKKKKKEEEEEEEEEEEKKKNYFSLTIALLVWPR